MEVERKDGTVAAVTVHYVTPAVWNKKTQQWVAYGHIDNLAQDRSARAESITHTPRDPHAPRWQGGRVRAPVSVLDRGKVEIDGDVVEIAAVSGPPWEYKGVRMAWGVPRERANA
jgi:hypothetical protein